jgi:soluble lytic murein transglycosylase-like protein
MAFSAGWAEEEFDSAGCEVSSRFPSKVRRWCGLISGYARQADLPPDLVAALIWQESGGDPNALSHSGAVGLMQVMPRDGQAAAFRCKGRPCFSDRPTMAELRDPEFNLRYGTRLLSDLVKKYHGDLRKALRAYGPMDMGYGYADIVLSLYQKYGNP